MRRSLRDASHFIQFSTGEVYAVSSAHTSESFSRAPRCISGSACRLAIASKMPKAREWQARMSREIDGDPAFSIASASTPFMFFGCASLCHL